MTTDIVKRICKVHGKLFEADLIKKGKLKSGNQAYRCRKCMKEMHRRHYEANREKVLGSIKKYREENRERVRTWKREYDCKYRERDAEKKRKRQRKLYYKQREMLHDRYIRHLICKRSLLRYGDITPSLVEMKRTLIIAKKYIKNSKTKLSLKSGENHDENK